MRLWTIQPATVWEILETQGVFRTDPRFVDPDVLPAYTWIAARMQERLGPLPQDCCLPVWAWYQWAGEKRRKPDLRAGGYLPKGQHGVRLELEVVHSEALLSDYMLWHYVLNYWYLAATEEEGSEFEAELIKNNLSFYASKPLPHPTYHQQMERSWLRMFDLDWVNEEVTVPRAQKVIQATQWEVRRDQVRRVQFFTSR